MEYPEEIMIFDTYVVQLPYVESDISDKLIRSNSVAQPKIMDDMIYAPYYSRLFDLNRKINSIKPYLDDIMKSRSTTDLDNYNGYKIIDLSTSAFMISDQIKSGYVGNKDIKKNAINLFNPNNINSNWLSTFVDEKNLLVKLPTCETKAVIDYLYIMSSLFKSVKLIKHKHDIWFIDSFLVECSDPVKHKINNINKMINLKKHEKYHISEILSFRVDSELFLKQWRDFHMFMYNKIYAYTTILLNSMDKKSINNPYQDILKKPYAKI